VLDQDGGEALDRTEDSSVDDDGATEARLQLVLAPNELLVVKFVLAEDLLFELFLLLILILGVMGMSLLFSCVLGLVLKVESNGKLEITLDGTTLVLSAEGVVHLDIDLGAVEGTIAVIVGPWAAESIERFCEGVLSFVPLFFRAETLFRSG